MRGTWRSFWWTECSSLQTTTAEDWNGNKIRFQMSMFASTDDCVIAQSWIIQFVCVLWYVAVVLHWTPGQHFTGLSPVHADSGHFSLIQKQRVRVDYSTVKQAAAWALAAVSNTFFYLELASTAAYKSKANAEPALSFSLNPNVIASLCTYSFAAIGLSSCVWWACRQSPAGAHSASALWPLCLAAGQSRVYLFLSVEAERLHVTGVSQTDLKLRSDWGRRGKALNWTLGRMKDNKFI